MGVHLFVDESRRGSTYLLVAAVIEPPQLASMRSLMRHLCMPGERRIHFQAEHDSRRRKILAELVAAKAQAQIYLGTGKPERVRSACLSKLVNEAMELSAARLVLESRGMVADRTDRSTIHRALGGQLAAFSYEHLCPHDDPALAIADAIAWAHGAGGTGVAGSGRSSPRSWIWGLWPRTVNPGARAPVVRRVLPGSTSTA